MDLIGIALCLLVIAFIGYRWITAAKQNRLRNLLRSANLAKHPAIFDKPALTDIAHREIQTVDLYDCDLYDYLGETSFGNIEWLVNYLAGIHEDCLPNGINDIPFSIDDIDQINEFVVAKPDGQFLELLEPFLSARHMVIIRWVPKNGG